MSFFNNIVWSPIDYAEASVVAHEASEEMFSRLSWMTLKPQIILEAGCGTGEASARLQTYYPNSRVLAVDLAESMIQYAHAYSSGFSCLCANAEKLPLPNQSIDLIFANLLLPWHANLPILFQEWRRVLSPEGVVMMSALGPDTLKEYRMGLHNDAMPSLVDMHDLGDLLLQHGFVDPVLDVNYYTLTYKDTTRLLKELQASGMLCAKYTSIDLNDAALTEEGTWPVTYEVVFAHAFAPADMDTVATAADGVVRIPLANLRRRLSVKDGIK
ncbi:MAG: methyltransferase domain-containing protein [Gammaproteobacteria bacterium]|nr:methyltransferase domain-containing protein [Gammaproteobacteria bacterium]MCW5583300.1 methyltransferase domain-containing protein [Gammaproteobacteria bacterium]